MENLLDSSMVWAQFKMREITTEYYTDFFLLFAILKRKLYNISSGMYRLESSENSQEIQEEKAEKTYV